MTESNAKPVRATTKRRRRWLQYSLRGLLVLMLLSAIGAWWLSIEVGKARREEQALARLKDDANYAFDVRFSYQVLTNWDPKPNAVAPGPEWLRSLLGDAFFDEPIGIMFGGDEISDEAARGFRDLPDLQGIMADTLTPLSPQFVAEVATLRKLRSLDIQCEGTFSSEMIGALSPLPMLETINVPCGTLDSADARRFVHGKSKLAWLGLYGCNYGPGALAELGNLRALTHFEIGGMFDPIELEELGRTPLESLGLSGQHIDDTTLEHVAAIKSLKRLDARETSITDAGLASLLELPNLETLILYDSHVTGSGFQQLAKHKSLSWVSLKGVPMAEDGWSALASVASLQRILISTIDCDGTALNALSRLPNLNQMRISKTKINDADLAVLAEYPSLRSLLLTGVGFTDAAMPHLASLPLEELDLPSGITPASVPLILQMTSLKKLRLPGNFSYQVTATIKAALPNCSVTGGTSRPPGAKNADGQKR